ncbi:hypothetical protein Ddye_009340 [Dipteronia dyeriana]|uniref:DUF1985 domain-containing protein n=1 Tax=Dipteronia dyeriana TaxID=168575 RepID=A0AAD9XC71_9ROSI|nr:hypothetical protein Ddye_009340 [Dipteronia dyeriana]
MMTSSSNELLKTPEGDWFKGKLTRHDHFEALARIDVALNRVSEEFVVEDPHRFMASCFRHFMSMHLELKFSGGVIHQLLLRNLDHDGLTDEIRFLLGNHVVRFSKVEFSLITGLRFGVVPDTSMYVAVENGIHQRYFPGHDEVSLDDLRVVLTRGEFQQAYDAVKLCLIYMLNWILIGVDERLKIPVWWFWLADDLNAFDTFPWAAHVYRHSIFSFKHALPRCLEERRQQSQGDVGHSVERYNIYGLSHALLIFAFEMSARTEIVPTTAEAVAQYFAGLSEGRARMCRMTGFTFLLSLIQLLVQIVPRRRVGVGGGWWVVGGGWWVVGGGGRCTVTKLSNLTGSSSTKFLLPPIPNEYDSTPGITHVLAFS